MIPYFPCTHVNICLFKILMSCAEKEYDETQITIFFAKSNARKVKRGFVCVRAKNIQQLIHPICVTNEYIVFSGKRM